MHSSIDTMSAPQLPRSWMVASLAFAFLVGLSLSIPLINEMSLAPTGYDQSIAGEISNGDGLRAQSIIEKNIPGPCQYCAVSRERVPAETSPSVVDPLVAFRGSAGVEV